MNQPSKKKIIIDTDAGLDDAQAILMAMGSNDVQVVAITTVMGNTGPFQVAKNVLRVLNLADRLDIPIYVGCDKALNGYIVNGCGGYHGCDGFGECPDPEVVDPSIIKQEDGVSALLRLSKTHADITLVCIGPLTNIATAIRRDVSFGNRLKECFIMGGNYYGKGNVTPSAEFNFHVDPEAAREVMMHLTCPKTLLGWEICTSNSFSWDWYQKFLRTESSKIQYLAKLEKYAMEIFYIPNINKGLDQHYEMADQLLMAVVLNGNVCLEAKQVYVDIELKGELTRAQMFVDWNNTTGRNPNVKIVTKIDKCRVETMLLEALS